MPDTTKERDFDIRRAYEAWVAAGEPMSDDGRKGEKPQKSREPSKKRDVKMQNPPEKEDRKERISPKRGDRENQAASSGDGASDRPKTPTEKKSVKAFVRKGGLSFRAKNQGGKSGSRPEITGKPLDKKPADEKNGKATSPTPQPPAKRDRAAAVTLEESRKTEPPAKRDRASAVTLEESRKTEPPAKREKICPYNKRCGGCAYIERDYAWTLGFKEAKVRELLRPFVRLSGIVGMEDPYHYRNKVHAVFAHVRDGHRERNVAGIYEAGTHKVVAVKGCKIENEKAGEIIQTILGMLRDFKIKVYDEDMDYGLLRHVLVRTGRVTGEIMVVLVLASPILPNKNAFVKTLLEKHPEITTIILNVNDQKTSMVLGNRETVLYGKGYIEDVLLGKRYRISSRSFYQVNPVQTEKLYRTAIKMANLTGRERVVDAYCGIGTIGISAADRAREVIGVELNAEAVRDAIRNAKTNAVSNISFYEGDAGDFLVDMAEEGEMVDVVFLDPPRTGSTQRFLEAAAALRPGRIIYISCGPDTLARDLAILKKLGYQAREATAFDMFPFTEHCEVVVSLTKGAAKKGKQG